MKKLKRRLKMQSKPSMIMKNINSRRLLKLYMIKRKKLNNTKKQLKNLLKLKLKKLLKLKLML